MVIRATGMIATIYEFSSVYEEKQIDDVEEVDEFEVEL